MHENRETSEMPAVRISCRTAGEGLGRTARVFVPEESHRGIVPMKHSNKDETLSAESAEGRLRLKENALSPETYPTQSGIARVLRVGKGVRTGCAWPPFIQEKNRMRFQGTPTYAALGSMGTSS